MQFPRLFKSNSGAARFVLFGEKILPQLEAMRPQLEKMYCADNGRPGEEPSRLLGALLLQFMERAPDRQAAELCAFDLRWKLALGMEADEPAFHSTCLVRFRQRLLEHGLEALGFEGVLDAMGQAGYLGRKQKRQRLDSTHVFGLVSNMSRLENVRETLRLALEFLERQPDLWRPENWPVWWERHVQSKPDYRAKKTQLQSKFEQAGADAQELLDWIDARFPELAQAKPIELLRRVFEENFEVDEAAKSVARRAQPPGAVHNPHDPQAQWSSKSTTPDKQWVGYKAQVSETVAQSPCEPGEPTPNVITAVQTQEATASDKAALAPMEEQWQERGVEAPDTLYTDGGYTSGAELARAQEEGRQLQGPMAAPPTKDKRFNAADFEVSVEERRASCPAGRTNSQCSRLEEGKSGKVSFRFECARADCQECPLNANCLGKGQKHRTLSVGEHHTLIQERRREQKTDEFKAEMHRRNGIEATISELKRGYGMRRARYRGLAKTRLQNFMIGAACNIRRWWRRSAWESPMAAN